jgi:UDP-N-acetylmuramoyl-L-alanyl-D-glutamate--2,6-diaminopimelate ligase
LPKDAFAITNIDDRNGMVMTQNTKAKVITYSCRSIADHTCRVVEQSFEGMLLRMDNQEVWSGLIGQHNAYNLLALYTTAVTLGADPEETLVAISALKPAPGRLENIRGPKGTSIIIDYAHTPDGLENVLKLCLELKSKDAKLISVFGCGGNRETQKRKIMGEISSKLANFSIITTDNPRFESRETIADDIIQGMKNKNYLVILDRCDAIKYAYNIANPGDIVLIAGKGEENYIDELGIKKPYSDKNEVLKLRENQW